ncbi:hypothetical protein F511_29911 [Dorcoceras hygrometricum]|uniref:Transmembrane protein n=1 Tax=Dorcoceras hygrometricum TaxID=472368 RepID=A0A2Z7D8K2_9LAMI|nr:hypothetical protein F511_29911 [Dorcoceras hygrometricum]
MAILFAVSTCFQFNDPDWYFWIPLYTSACVVNLVEMNSRIRKLAKIAFWLGAFLFVKVVMEDCLNGIVGIWSLDMRERVVREKFGSGLVICSMFLQLEYSCYPDYPSRLPRYGPPILVCVAYGLSFGFFVFHRSEMRY